MQFNTTRTFAGEALFQLKYRHDWAQVTPIAAAIAQNIYPLFKSVGFIVPMPPSQYRNRQPVSEIATALGQLVQRPVFHNILVKEPTHRALKNLASKEDRARELSGKISLNDEIRKEGRWNVLLVDDRYETGASLEAACAVLRTYRKVGGIYVAAVTY
jgi:predicted amidophosphoribosyltransferase